MKFVHTGDLHLGMEPDKGKPWGRERAGELWEAFYRILDVCREEKMDLLLIAGDLFHRKPLAREWREVCRGFASIPDTWVVLVTGNHDYLSPRSVLLQQERPDNLILFEEEQWERIHLRQLSTYIYGFSYHGRKVPDRTLQEVQPGTEEGYHILLAHGGEEKRLPIPAGWFGRTAFDYAALGHIHKPALYGTKGGYCGSPEPLDCNETGIHGYICGVLEGNACQADLVPFAKREYKKLVIDINPEESEEFLLWRIRQLLDVSGQEHMYRLILEGYRNPNWELNREAFEGLGRIAVLEDNTIPDYDFEQLASENKENLIGHYIRAVIQSGASDEVADRALYLGMDALLHSQRK